MSLKVASLNVADQLDLTQLYRATTTAKVVDVPPMSFAMIDGKGDPNTSAEYRAAVEALFTLSYSLKFAIKRSGGADYKVSPLEGLWWAQDWTAFTLGDRSSWEWTAMIRQPADVSAELFRRIADEVATKKHLVAIDRVRLETFTEGLAVQVLHVGPYSAEGPTIEALHTYLAEQGYRFDGARHKHHEIYLSDPRRAAPEKLRTIIRQPVAVASQPTAR
jgi:hypothetical protein